MIIIMELICPFGHVETKEQTLYGRSRTKSKREFSGIRDSREIFVQKLKLFDC